jgi:hypothetical protein
MKAGKKMLAAFGAMILAGGLCISLVGNNFNAKRYLSPKVARANAEMACYCSLLGGNDYCTSSNYGETCDCNQNFCEG